MTIMSGASEEDAKNSKDTQLEKAIEIAKS